MAVSISPSSSDSDASGRRLSTVAKQSNEHQRHVKSESELDGGVTALDDGCAGGSISPPPPLWPPRLRPPAHAFNPSRRVDLTYSRPLYLAIQLTRSAMRGNDTQRTDRAGGG